MRGKRHKKRKEAGFSLMEVLVTITLIALATAFVGSQVYNRLEEGKAKAAEIQIRNFMTLLEDYRRLCQRYPSTEQGLEALIEPSAEGAECPRYPQDGFIKEGKIPLDPWDNPYIYESLGNRNFVISSLGSQGVEGGEGSEKDIRSDDL